MRVVREIASDAAAITRAFVGDRYRLRDVAIMMSHDGSQVLVLSRLREAAARHGIPIAGSILRRVQTSLFGVEIARDVRLGEGVVFVHTVGVVIGGDSRIGDRVVFLGGNTIGTVNNRGYPRIGSDVVIGAGARILGPLTVGDGASIGANAVVLNDVPAGAVAVGIPAVVKLHEAPLASELRGAVSAPTADFHGHGARAKAPTTQG
jgi:serine acetyltransferase